MNRGRTAAAARTGGMISAPVRTTRCEVVVIGHTSYDRYPETDERLIGRGASGWFKAQSH